MENNISAFFDLDNTVIRGSSMFHLARGLVGENFLSRRDLLQFAYKEYKFIWTRTESLADRNGICVRGLTLIKGLEQAEMEALCERIVSNFLPQSLNPQMLQQIRHHQSRNTQTWLITASPIEVALPIAKSLGMNGAIATQLETLEGRYTGQLLDGLMHGARKSEAVIRLASHNNIDLDRSFAYSDSESDLPLLSLVRFPNVVNPNVNLLRLARKNRWPIWESSRLDASHSIPNVLREVISHEDHPWFRCSEKPNGDLVRQSRLDMHTFLFRVI